MKIRYSMIAEVRGSHNTISPIQYVDTSKTFWIFEKAVKIWTSLPYFLSFKKAGNKLHRFRVPKKRLFAQSSPFFWWWERKKEEQCSIIKMSNTRLDDCWVKNRKLSHSSNFVDIRVRFRKSGIGSNYLWSNFVIDRSLSLILYASKECKKIQKNGGKTEKIRKITIFLT